MSFRRLLTLRLAPEAAFAFLVSVAFVPHIYSAAVALRWSLLAAGLPLLCWLDPRRLSPTLRTCTALLLAYAGASIFWAPDRLTAGFEYAHLLIFAAALVYGASLRSLDAVMRGLAWGLCVSAVLVVPQLLGHSPVDQFAAPAGLLFNRDVLGEFAAVILVWAFLGGRIGFAAIAGLVLLATGSRVGIAAAALSLAALDRRWLVPMTLAAVGATLIAWLFPEKTLSLWIRINIWRAVLDGITPFGHGIGAFETTHPWWEYGHSDFLQAGYELGLGAVPLLGIFAAPWRRSRDTRRADRAAFLCVVIECAVGFPLHLPLSAFLAGVLAGHLGRARSPLRDPGHAGRVDAGGFLRWGRAAAGNAVRVDG